MSIDELNECAGGLFAPPRIGGKVNNALRTTGIKYIIEKGSITIEPFADAIVPEQSLSKLKDVIYGDPELSLVRRVAGIEAQLRSLGDDIANIRDIMSRLVKLSEEMSRAMSMAQIKFRSADSATDGSLPRGVQVVS